MIKTERILLFNVNWLGDVVFSTAVIRNLRYNFPDAYIACALPARCRDILINNPNLDEIILFDERIENRSLISKLKFIFSLRSKKFNRVYFLHRSASRMFICFLAGIKKRIGYARKKSSWFLTDKIKSQDINNVHRLDYYLGVLRGSGLKIKDRHTDFFFNEADEKKARQLIGKTDNFFVGINPGGNWGPKRWPKDKWIELVKRLSSLPGVRILITGGAKDKLLAEEIKTGAGIEADILCGKLNLNEFAALCKFLDIFITADSGPLHIANASRVKHIVALFGPTSALLTGPYPKGAGIDILKKDVGCKLPCYNSNCPDNRCMKAISVDEVLEIVNKYAKN